MAASAHESYREFLRHVEARSPISEAQWLGHFDHQNADATSGPAEGGRAPSFELPGSDGVMRSSESLMGPNGLLVVFARSADW